MSSQSLLERWILSKREKRWILLLMPCWLSRYYFSIFIFLFFKSCSSKHALLSNCSLDCRNSWKSKRFLKKSTTDFHTDSSYFIFLHLLLNFSRNMGKYLTRPKFPKPLMKIVLISHLYTLDRQWYSRERPLGKTPKVGYRGLRGLSKAYFNWKAPLNQPRGSFSGVFPWDIIDGL